MPNARDVGKRYEAYGWHVEHIDGHNHDAIATAHDRALAETGRPSLLVCETVIAKGAVEKEGSEEAHGSPLGEDEVKGAREQIGWRHQPFEVPKSILATWRTYGSRHRAAYDTWNAAAKRLEASARAALTDPIDAQVKAAIEATVGFALSKNIYLRFRACDYTNSESNIIEAALD